MSLNLFGTIRGWCADAYEHKPQLDDTVREFVKNKFVVSDDDLRSMTLKELFGYKFLCEAIGQDLNPIFHDRMVPTVADIEDLDLKSLIEMSKFLKIEKASDDVIRALEKRTAPTGVDFMPGEQSKYMVFGHTNLRMSSATVSALIAVSALLYRGLEERSRDVSYMQFKAYYNESEKAIIKSFLDDVLTYNPADNIDRLTSEYYDPEKKLKMGKKEVSIRGESTTRKGSKKTVKKAVATVKEDDIEVTIDLQAEAFAKVMNYMRINYDAIHKITNATTTYGSFDAAERDLMAPNEYIEQEITTYKVTDGKREKVNTLTVPGPEKQWEDVVYVVGDLFDDVNSASAHMMKMKNKTIMPLNVGRTDAMILTGEWHNNRKNVIVGDPQIDAMIQQIEGNNRIYQEMTKERVKFSKVINMIEQGPDSKEFKKFVGDLKPDARGSLTEEESEEVVRKWRNYINEHKVHDNSNANFMDFCRRKRPGRDFNRKPMTMAERKELSKLYNQETDMLELAKDSETVGIDMFKQTPEGLETYREYSQLPTITPA